MRALLDTHIVIWLAVDLSRIPLPIRRVVERADVRLVSVISYAEVAFKHRKSPSAFRFSGLDLKRTMEDLQATELPLIGNHIEELSRIPILHKDPFDHLLMAQAISEDCPFATQDQSILSYKVKGLHFIS